ncbi:hypothetical protein GCM10027190_04220 [Spirosoma areae]
MTTLLVTLYACVDSFKPTLDLNTNLVVVNGIITDQSGPQAINLRRSRSTNDSSIVTLPIRRAMVQVLVNGITLINLTEAADSGRYDFPVNFRGRVGDSYQLRFVTAEGSRYESTVEVMPAVPPIQRVYDQYNPSGPNSTVDKRPIPVNDVYVDYQDPAGQANFYLWRWTLYESQQWCKTCRQGRYQLTDTGNGLTGACVPDPRLLTYEYYDYSCLGFCWDVYRSQLINVFSDIYTNGQPQLGRLVAQIPVYQRDAAQLDIEQFALTAGAYRYYKLFADQTQNTGTLADTPPAPTAGNVRNLDDDSENVVGYFSASAVAVNHYRLDRQNVPVSVSKFGNLFYAQNGRSPVLESPRGDPSMPFAGLPSALCIPCANRTDKTPIGWR